LPMKLKLIFSNFFQVTFHFLISSTINIIGFLHINVNKKKIKNKINPKALLYKYLQELFLKIIIYLFYKGCIMQKHG